MIEAIFSEIVPEPAREALLPVDETNQNDPVTRAEIVDILWTDAGSPAVESPVEFFDAADDAAVDWAAATGITAGSGNGLFAGDNALSRAEMIGMLYTYAAPENAPEEAVWAAEMLLVGEVDLAANVTRAEASSWLEIVCGA